MTIRTRQDKFDRQDRDSGADDEEVFVRDPLNSTEIYHEEADCCRLEPDETVSMTRRAAQLRWLAPCKVCVLEEVHWRGP